MKRPRKQNKIEKGLKGKEKNKVQYWKKKEKQTGKEREIGKKGEYIRERMKKRGKITYKGREKIIGKYKKKEKYNNQFVERKKKLLKQEQ